MTGSRELDRSSSLGPLAERWRAAWADPTPQAFGRCCTVSVFYEDPVANEPLEGLDALARHAEALHRLMPDLRVEATAESVVEGDFGCVPWKLLGTHRGDLGAVPASGRFVVLHGVHYLELTDGRVRRARGFFDLYDAGVQLGLLPARGSLSETALLMLRGFGLRRR